MEILATISRQQSVVIGMTDVHNINHEIFSVHHCVNLSYRKELKMDNQAICTSQFCPFFIEKRRLTKHFREKSRIIWYSITLPFVTCVGNMNIYVCHARHRPQYYEGERDRVRRIDLEDSTNST